MKHDKLKSLPGRSGLSMSHYLAILRMTMKRSLSVQEIIEKLGRSSRSNAIHRTLVAMHQLGLLHITSWFRRGSRGNWMPKLRFGAGDDATYPGADSSKRFGARQHRIPATLIVLQHLLDAVDDWASVNAVVEATGLFHASARRALRDGHSIRLFRRRERRRVGIGGKPIVEFILNPEGLPDEPPVQPLGEAVMSRMKRERQRVRRQIEAANGAIKEAA